MTHRALTALVLAAYRLALRARLQQRRGAALLERPLRRIAATAAREREPRYGTAPRFLLPAIRKNPDGQRAMSWSTLNRRLQRWLEDGDVRDAAGKPVKITAHQFRHTVGTRMINNEVPLDIVQRMLDTALRR